MIQGTAFEQVVNPDVVDVPEHMAAFREIAEARFRTVQARG